MASDPWLQSFPTLLKSKPELFSNKDLQNLQQILAPLQNEPPEDADKILKDWFKARLPIREALEDLDDERQEVEKVRPSKSNDSKHITNIFQEISQQVQKILEQQNQSKNKQ